MAHTSKADLQYLSVKDSSSHYGITCLGCSDEGHNLGWTFNPIPTTSTSSGGKGAVEGWRRGGGRRSTSSPITPVAPSKPLTPEQKRREIIRKRKEAFQKKREEILKKQREELLKKGNSKNTK